MAKIKIKMKMTICLITKTIRMMTIKMKTTRYLIDEERGKLEDTDTAIGEK